MTQALKSATVVKYRDRECNKFVFKPKKRSWQIGSVKQPPYTYSFRNNHRKYSYKKKNHKLAYKNKNNVIWTMVEIKPPSLIMALLKSTLMGLNLDVRNGVCGMGFVARNYLGQWWILLKVFFRYGLLKLDLGFRRALESVLEWKFSQIIIKRWCTTSGSGPQLVQDVWGLNCDSWFSYSGLYEHLNYNLVRFYTLNLIVTW